MYYFKADGAEIKVPSMYDEIKLKVYLDYLDAKGSAEILSVLSGIPLEQLRELRAIDLPSKVFKLLTYLGEDPKFDTRVRPKYLYINGQDIKIPENLGAEANLGQKYDVDAELERLRLAEIPVNYITMSRSLLSIFLAPHITLQPYKDFSMAKGVMSLIDELPCTTALSLSAFFLTNFMKRQTSGRVKLLPNSPHERTSLLKSLKWKYRELLNTMTITPSSK